MSANWSIEDAQAAQGEFERQGGTPSDPTGPLYRWAALKTLQDLQQRFASGEQYALMQAIRKCANHDIAMPEWVSRAYIRAFDSVHNFRASSWDEVFGTPIPKGAQLASLRKRRMKSMQVWNEVGAAIDRGEAVDDSLFERVGKTCGLGLTQTKDYYTYIKRQFPELARARNQRR